MQNIPSTKGPTTLTKTEQTACSYYYLSLFLYSIVSTTHATMQSGFTQTLSMRNFLVMKRVPSDENSPTAPGNRNSGSNRRNSGSNARQNSGSHGSEANKNNSNSMSKRIAFANEASELEATQQQTYESLLRKSRRNIRLNEASSRNLNDLGPYSCHQIGRMNSPNGSNKPKVHFGEESFHQLRK